jgi:hypothetical protein
MYFKTFKRFIKIVIPAKYILFLNKCFEKIEIGNNQ